MYTWIVLYCTLDVTDYSAILDLNNTDRLTVEFKLYW